MDAILQTLLDLPGVTAAMVFDGGGQLLGHRGHSIYDRPLCEQVGAALVKAIDAVQLQQEDWETITAQFKLPSALAFRLSTSANPAPLNAPNANPCAGESSRFANNQTASGLNSSSTTGTNTAI